MPFKCFFSFISWHDWLMRETWMSRAMKLIEAICTHPSLYRGEEGALERTTKRLVFCWKWFPSSLYQWLPILLYHNPVKSIWKAAGQERVGQGEHYLWCQRSELQPQLNSSGAVRLWAVCSLGLIVLLCKMGLRTHSSSFEGNNGDKVTGPSTRN